MPWTTTNARTFGLRIRALRLESGHTQESLAHLAGVTKNQIQLIEAGRGNPSDPAAPSNPRMTTLFGIADALGRSPSSLLEE